MIVYDGVKTDFMKDVRDNDICNNIAKLTAKQ